MFLIPFVLKKTERVYPVYIIHVFLNRGCLFLQVNQEEIEDFCKENGLFYNKKFIKNDMCYLDIDSEKTNLKEFYSYYENSEEECWRKFILIGNYSEDFLHLNKTNPEFIMPHLKNILNINKE